jgi:hypothetical protein
MSAAVIILAGAITTWILYRVAGHFPKIGSSVMRPCLRQRLHDNQKTENSY